ncbi:MFS transporter [Alteribacillus bidgolensis]|uniref:Sugar phosphate permease n=1 Tax=Alteribacillus bidgolensis TaxID=930129 RepID=A0A1G8H2K6_9BACI|nr:MFS transporter [Alteribacillus bidgolensis]SDI00878.1 Sugar phosphate permease [Alteribacillus bidgolensis]
MENQTLAHHTSDPSVRNQPWRMLGWLLFTQVLVAFAGRSLAPLGVFIGESLMLTNAQIGMLPAALFFGQFAVSIPSGMLVDRVGTRPLLLALSLCLGLSFFFAALTSNFMLLLMFVVIGGLGYGAMHPTSNRGILYWFERRSRGTAMGIKQMGVTVGSALASLLLVPLSAAYGWRPVFIGAAFLLTVAGLISYLRYRDAKATSKTPSAKKENTWKTLLSMGKNKAVLLVSFGAVGLSSAQMIVNTYIIIYTTQVIGISVALAAILLVISEIAGSVGRVMWGVVSDRLFKGNRFILLSMIAIISAASAVVMALLPPGTPFTYVALLAFVFGLCIAGFNGLWMNAATELVPLKQAGLASGFSISVGSWGVIIGPPLFGFITDITGTFTAGWYALAVVLVITAALFISLHLFEKKKGDINNAE